MKETIEKKLQGNLPFAKTNKLTKILIAAVLIACLFTTCGNKAYSCKKSNKDLNYISRCNETSYNYFDSYLRN